MPQMPEKPTDRKRRAAIAISKKAKKARDAKKDTAVAAKKPVYKSAAAKKPAAKKPAAKKPAARTSATKNPWLAHVQKYRCAHSCTLAEAMKRARPSYRSSSESDPEEYYDPDADKTPPDPAALEREEQRYKESIRKEKERQEKEYTERIRKEKECEEVCDAKIRKEREQVDVFEKGREEAKIIQPMVQVLIDMAKTESKERQDKLLKIARTLNASLQSYWQMNVDL